MAKQVSTFLMFSDGRGEEAMKAYVKLFAGSAVEDVQRWRKGEPGPEGAFKTAVFKLAGHRLMVLNSPTKHDFTFTPATSLFVDCESETELETAFAQLSAGGAVLMPLDNYGFSRKFAWLNDRFGVSWQLNLP